MSGAPPPLDAGIEAGSLNAGGMDSGPDRSVWCQAICQTETELVDCQPASTCAEDLCGIIDSLPPECVDEYDAYNACLAGEPVTSFDCADEIAQANVGNNGCGDEECAFYACMNLPAVCTP